MSGHYSQHSDNHKKFCSPPPKPPRRRHSDQSSISSCGPFVPNRKKYLNNNFNSDSSNVNSSAGSESLPACWVSDVSDPPVNGCSKNTKSVYVSVKSPTLPINMSTPEEQSVCTSQITFNGNRNLIPDLLARKNLSPDGLESLNLQSSVFPKKCSNLYDKSASSDSSSPAFNISESAKIIHRRHHSDPLHLLSIKSFQLHTKCHRNSSKDMLVDDSTAVRNFTSMDPFLLSEEIRVLRETNDKLWKHLGCLQAKLDCSQMALPESQTENSLSFADLVADIYFAQKEKDLVFELRLKAALDERDSAIKELEEVLQSLTSAFEENASDDEIPVTDKELRDIIQKMEATQNPAVLVQQQSILLSFLSQAKECKLQRLSHDLKIVQEEKEQALEKVKKLTDQMKELKALTNSSHSDLKQWESSLVGMLCQVITERDSAVNEMSSLKEHICDASNGLYKEKLDIDVNNILLTANDKDSSACLIEMDNYEDVENSPETVYALKSKICTLTKQLDSEKKLRLSAQKKYDRLGRIFVSTINKMNGLDVGIPV